MNIELTLPLWAMSVLLMLLLMLALGWLLSFRGFRMQARLAETYWQERSTAWQQQVQDLKHQSADALQQQNLLRAQLGHEQAQHHQEALHWTEQQARQQEREIQWQQQWDSLQQAKEQLNKEFENTANRLFELKQDQFVRSSQVQLDAVINPFREQMKEFKAKVEESSRIGAAHHHQMVGQIQELQKQSHQISLEAVQLTQALKGNNKMMGNWGEMILTRILEQMGLQLGREYDVQMSLHNDEGKRRMPDVIVYLPNDRQLILDSKVSLIAYEKYVNFDHDQQALKEHIDSIRAHIRGLSQKNYAALLPSGSLEFVSLFVPIEAAFNCAVQAAPELLQEAYDRKVLLVSPSGIFVLLKCVLDLWQRDRQDRNVELIMELAGKLYDQCARFIETYQEMGVQIDKAKKSYDLGLQRLSQGNGNLVKRTEDLKKLGAKAAKKINLSSVEDVASIDLNKDEKLN